MQYLGLKQISDTIFKKSKPTITKIDEIADNVSPTFVLGNFLFYDRE